MDYLLVSICSVYYLILTGFLHISISTVDIFFCEFLSLFMPNLVSFDFTSAIVLSYSSNKLELI